MTQRIAIDNDISFSRIVAGMMNLNQWSLDAAELGQWIDACLEMGITTFDHADIYGGYTCEALFGRAMTPDRRERMELVSKCGIALVTSNRPEHRIKHYNTSRAHIIRSAERSLKNLRTDYLDLLLIHRPDPLLDAAEVAAAFSSLREAGKVRRFGVSNFTPAQFDHLAAHCPMPLVANQIQLSVLHLPPLHDGTLDHAGQHGVRPMAWSPVAGGAIFRGDDARGARVKAALTKIGEARDLGIDQVALAWLMSLPQGVMPVLGTGKLERLRRAVAAADVTLSRQEWFSIWEASAGEEVP